ncbi:MAG: hypothetical protein Q9219_000248 [cf. Caloplaca sp. 3 TL-2023]
MHDSSIEKLRTLEKAETSYKAAIAALPQPENPSKWDDYAAFNEFSSKTPPRCKTTNDLHSLMSRMGEAPPFISPGNAFSATSPTSTQRLSVTFSESSQTWLYQRSCERYNKTLVDLSNMIQNHLMAVNDLISEIREARTNRSIKRMASFHDDREARATDLRERIDRLRAKGWRRERFRPERYETLCSLALAEL